MFTYLYTHNCIFIYLWFEMMVNKDLRHKLKPNQKFLKNIYCLDLRCFACLYLKLADVKFRPKMPCLSDHWVGHS